MRLASGCADLARCTSTNVVANEKRVLMATGMHVALRGMTRQPVVVLLHCASNAGHLRVGAVPMVDPPGRCR